MRVTSEQVEAAYRALESGDPAEIDRWWSEDMRWLVPGHHQLAGWWVGRTGFMDFMGRVGELSGDSFSMTRHAILLGEGASADVSHNVGTRAGADPASTSPYVALEIDVVHLLTWRDGRVVEGKGAIFGDGTSEFDLFWSQVLEDGTRV